MKNEKGRIIDNNYDKWIWVELSTFKSDEKDKGVTEYINKLTFKPDGIFLDIRYTDFVHNHNENKDNEIIDNKYVSAYERIKGKNWNKKQLKDFIEEFHMQDVKVLLSMMALTYIGPIGTTVEASQWVEKHQEIKTVDSYGKKLGFINPLKRLKDGSFYEDFFIGKLIETINYYKFDGFHAADGFAHLRLPLHESDYSDDMVKQFLDSCNLQVPKNFIMDCDKEPDKLHARAGWIWEIKRMEWINFYRTRWSRFHSKLSEACKQEKKILILNQPWTKEPYEALYCYGFDYKEIENKVDALVAETVGGVTVAGGYVVEKDEGTLANKDTDMWLEDAASMVMTVKAYAPSLKLIFLCAIRDEAEEWDIIGLLPALLEREIFSYTSTFLIDNNGNYKPCLDGVVFCLGDNLSNEEWKKLICITNKAFSLASAKDVKPKGATVIWSNEAMEKQLLEHCNKRMKIKPSFHTLLKKLIYEDAPIKVITRTENIKYIEDTAIIINPGYFLKEEEQKYISWLDENDKRSIVLVGNLSKSFRSNKDNDIEINELVDNNFFQCRVVTNKRDDIQFVINSNFGTVNNNYSINTTSDHKGSLRLNISKSISGLSDDGQKFLHALQVSDKRETLYNEEEYIKEDKFLSWAEKISYIPISSVFINLCSSIIRSISNIGVNSSFGKTFVLEIDGEEYVFLENKEPVYLKSKIKFQKNIKSAEFFSIFLNKEILINKDYFDITVAPYGIRVIKVITLNT